MAGSEPDAGAAAEPGASPPPQAEPRKAEPFNAEAIAQKPGVQEAFAKAFGGPKPKARGGRAAAGKGKPAEEPKPGSTRRGRQEREESAEELDGLDDDEHVQDDEERGKDKPHKEPPPPAEGDQPKPPVKKGEEGEADDGKPTLNPVLLQAAKRRGWSEEEINALAEENPEVAERTFTRLLADVNDLSRQYALVGRSRTGQPELAPDGRPARAAPGAPATPKPPADLLEDVYGPEKAQALREKYDGDFIKEVIEPLVAPVQEAASFMREQQEAAVASEVQSFFKEMAAEFEVRYGKGGKFTDEQYDARMDLCREADYIRAGARLHGIALSVGESLERAFHMQAAEDLERIERERLTSKVKRRSSSLTHRPSQRSKPSGEPPKKSKESAMAAYETRAAELGLETT